MIIQTDNCIIGSIAYIGLAYILYKSFSIILWLLILIQSPYNLIERYGKDSWAIITGSTDGIGKGFCLQLAKRNFNICLIARNAKKAEDLVKELININKSIKTKIVLSDFVQSFEKGFFENIYEQIKHLDIGILVNNVGINELNHYDKYSEQCLLDNISVNCASMVLLTKKVLPLMLSRSQRSGLVNVASFVGEIPCPINSIYSATKVFNDYFSRALQLEYKEKVDILSLRPMYVTTKMTGYQKSFGAISPETCADGCLKQLGYSVATNGYWSHRLQRYILNAIPQQIIQTVMYTFLSKLVAKLQKKKNEKCLEKKQ